MIGQRDKAAVDTARDTWGADPPEWVSVLAQEADRTSGAKAGARIGYSPAVVSQVIRCKYRGDMGKVERAVQSALMGAAVVCPDLGEIKLAACIEHQKHARAGNRGNTFRARMARACGGCPQASKGGRQ